MINLDKIPLNKYNDVCFRVKLTLKELKDILSLHFVDYQLRYEYSIDDIKYFTLTINDGISSNKRYISLYYNYENKVIDFLYNFHDSEHYTYSSTIIANTISRYSKLYYI